MKHKKIFRKTTAAWVTALALVLQMGFATAVMAQEPPAGDPPGEAVQEYSEDGYNEAAAVYEDTGATDLSGTENPDAENPDAENPDAGGTGDDDGQGTGDEGSPEGEGSPETVVGNTGGVVPEADPDKPAAAAGTGISADGSEIPQQPADVAATEVYYSVSTNQTEARSMLSLINGLRTGEYVTGRGEDVDYSDLGELVYDEDLETIALMRAAETAIYWSHTRPDGEEAWSAYTDFSQENGDLGCTAVGENVAWGTDSAQNVFVAWTEGDSGNLSNLMNPNFNSVGIACVNYNGTYYWAIELAAIGRNAGLTGSGPAEDTEGLEAEVSELAETGETGTESGPVIDYVTVRAKVADGIVTGTDLTASTPGYDLAAQESAELPTFSGIISTSGTQPENTACTIDRVVTTGWSSADPSIAEITGDTVTAVSGGTTTIGTTVFGQEYDVTVTVTQAFEECTFTFDPESGTYDGTAQEPAVIVTNGSTTLTPDVDYTVSYDNNVNAGTATVTVTATGNYEGQVTLGYQIDQRSVTPSITGTTTKAYDGTAAAPEGLAIELSGVIDGDEVSAEAAGYEYNSADAAEATTITASGITLSGSSADNYVLSADTAQTEGTITKADAVLAFLPDFSLNKTYDGTEADSPTLADLEETAVPDDEIIFEWYAGEPESGNVLPEAPTDAGNYNAVARVADGSNYTADPAVLPVTIAKADFVPNDLEVTVEAEKAETGVTVGIVDLIQEGAVLGEPVIGGEDEELIDGIPEVTEEEVTFDTTSQKDGAAATITIPVTDCTNFNDYEITIHVTAVKSDTGTEPDTETEPGPETGGSDEPDTETEPGPETGGTDEPNPETETEPGPVTSETDEPNPETETEPGPVTSVTDEPNPEPDTEPGPVTSVTDEPNPETETEPGPVVSEPVADNSITFTGDLVMTYDGMPAGVSIKAEYGANTATFKWTDSEGDVLTTAPTDAGTYDLEVSISDTSMYSGATADATVVIDQATPKVTLEDKEAVYTGEVITIDPAKVTLVNGENYTGSVTYTYYSDEGCTQKINLAAPADVGTYYVLATIPASENYTAGKSNVAVLSIIGSPSEGGITSGTDGGVGGTTTASGGHTGISIPVLIIILAACAVAAIIIVMVCLRRRDANKGE